MKKCIFSVYIIFLTFAESFHHNLGSRAIQVNLENLLPHTRPALGLAWSQKGITDPSHITNLTAHVTFINQWIRTNTSDTTAPLNSNHNVLNQPSAPSISYLSNPSNESPQSNQCIQQLQLENERLQQQLQIQQLQNQLQHQQQLMANMQKKMDDMNRKEVNRKSQVSYLRTEKEKKKV